MRGIVQTHGTGSGLFDAYEHYKRHIAIVMKTKYKEKKVLSIEPEWPRFIFNPDHTGKQAWNMVVIILLLYTFILTPYLIAFEDVVIGSDWFYVDVFVDCCFFIDIFVTLNSAYINKDGEFVVSRKLIFLHYLKGMLIIDFFSVFPFYLIGNNNSARSNKFIRFLRMARLSRIFRASKLINIMKYCSTSSTMEAVVDFFKNNSGITRLLSAMNVVLLITHFTACMWYYSARLDDFSPDTWVVRAGLVNDSKSKLYLTSLYWALATLTTVGFGDINAFTVGEKVICMLWMMFGVGFYSFTVGTVTSVLSSIDAKSSMINSKLALIELFAKDSRLPDDLIKRVTKLVKAQAETVTLDDKQRQMLLLQMPKNLRFEIAMTMHGSAASKIDFIKSQKSAFVASIVPLMQFLVRRIDEYIYKKGDYAEEMYFVATGRVNYLFAQTGTVLKTIVTGSYFGEIEMLGQVPREYSTITECYCEFLTMGRQLFDVMLKNYPGVAKSLKDIADERKERNTAAQQELVELLEKVEIRREVTLENLAGMLKETRTLPSRQSRRSRSVSDVQEKIPKGSNKVLDPTHINSRLIDLRRELQTLMTYAQAIKSKTS
mmetsp:Transcript_28857/g.51417  ORF Transcript_28857/g.51417 Transcript_28857/m.51417 type:complete len:601 (+) Transcript_28857:635-2437(+)